MIIKKNFIKVNLVISNSKSIRREINNNKKKIIGNAEFLRNTF
jgi:hypothetical protein